MRTLTANELDELFAGQNATTLPTVTVTAPKYNNSYSPYSGSGWGSGVTFYESYGSQVSCYSTAGSYYALPWYSAPDMKDLRCETNAAADPGMTIPASATFEFINKYAHQAPNNDRVYNDSSNHPPGYGNVTGYASANWNGIYLYGHGAVGATSTEPYTDPATGVQHAPWVTSMTGLEHQLLTAAHEAAHGRGIVDERLAEGYAINALKRYRQNGPKCP